MGGDFRLIKGRDLAKHIDHSCFRPDATFSDIQSLCDEANSFGFRAVCVNSAFVAACRKVLKKMPCKVVATIGFPLGACTTETKAFECKRAAEDGADEFEVVIALGQLRGTNYPHVERDLDAVVRAASGSPVRAIVEASLLSKEELVLACKLASNAGAVGVKTSTGFSGSGASLEQIRLMRAAVGSNFAIKASGGIRTYVEAVNLLCAGANLLGTSAGPRIITAHESGPGSGRD